MANEIRSSNASIMILDKAYKWLPSNTANGVWRPDATATLGYEPQGSEFTIYYGYVLADDTEEYLAQFTGLLQDDPAFDSTSGIVTISLVGKAESMLEATDAQAVCTTLTDQTTTPASGNGVLKAFVGALKSIWEMTNIRAAAVTKTLGQDNDYTVDALNDAEATPTINFNTGKEPTGTILYNARQWYRDKGIGELVGLLCDAAGITAGNRYIEEPLFESIASSVNEDTTADFDAGLTIQNITTVRTANRISKRWHLIDDFAGTLAKWTTGVSGSGTVAISAGAMVLTCTGAPDVASATLISFDGNRVIHSIEFTATVTNAGAQMGFLGSGSSIGPGVPEPVFRLDLNGTHTWRFVRGPSELDIYKDGVWVAGQSVGVSVTSFGFTCSAVATVVTIDNIYFSEEALLPVGAPAYAGVTINSAVSALAAIHDSVIFDLGATPVSWAAITGTETLYGGTIAYQTNASADGAAFDGWVATNADNVPQSTLRRYVKLRKTITAASGSYISPIVGPIYLNFAAIQLFIKSADFTGMNCREAVQALAKQGGMEFGTKGDGTFFFRNKTARTTPDLVLSQKNAIVSVSAYSPGYRDVKTIAQVRYGKSGAEGYYFSEYKASNAGEASPTTAQRFGGIVLAFDLDKFLFSNSAAVAGAIARKIYTQNYRPKRKLRIKCRIIPHLDLSDVVQISFHDSPLIEKAIFDDTFQKFPVTGPNARTLARDIIMKVVGHSPDIMRSESSIDLEEVLS